MLYDQQTSALNTRLDTELYIPIHACLLVFYLSSPSAQTDKTQRRTLDSKRETDGFILSRSSISQLFIEI